MEGPSGPDLPDLEWERAKPDLSPSWKEPDLSGYGTGSSKKPVLSEAELDRTAAESLIQTLDKQNQEWLDDPVNRLSLELTPRELSPDEVKQANQSRQNEFSLDQNNPLLTSTSPAIIILSLLGIVTISFLLGKYVTFGKK